MSDINQTANHSKLGDNDYLNQNIREKLDILEKEYFYINEDITTNLKAFDVL